MFSVLQGMNGNLPLIGILIACPAELVDKYISVISKHCPQQLLLWKPIHKTNRNERGMQHETVYFTDINLT